jgi:hypothetical protein
MAKDLGASNRRRSERVDTDGHLRAQLSMDAEVLALSSRGMMIRLGFTPEIGSRHSFTISFEDNVLSLLGTVRNSEPYTDGEHSAYRVGIEFEGIESHEEQILEGYVTSKLGA